MRWQRPGDTPHIILYKFHEDIVNGNPGRLDRKPRVADRFGVNRPKPLT